MYINPTHTPSADAMSPWLPPEAQAPATKRDPQTIYDCVIVGAGYTGLSTAHALARLAPQWRILVVDAMRVGAGSSGRNSGFVMDTGHWHGSWSLELNLALTKLSRYGLGRLRELVHEHRIDCDWYEGNRYHVAVNARGRRALGRFREGMRALGEPFVELTPAELAQRIGTHHYTSALRLDGGAFVEPCSLIRGVADGLPESVDLIEEQPVSAIEPGSPHVIRTAAGLRLRAKRVVLATNGFMPAWDVARSGILPFVTFASVTEPLAAPPGEDPQWGLVPEEPMGCTVRRTADGRLLFRNGVTLKTPPKITPRAIERAARDHRESLRRRFPAFGDVPFSHTWGGVIGATNNGGTVFGPIGDNAWACGAHNGVGMAMGTAMGDLLAHTIVGEDHPLLGAANALPKPAWVPPQPLLGVGVTLYVALLALLAGAEK